MTDRTLLNIEVFVAVLPVAMLWVMALLSLKAWYIEENWTLLASIFLGGLGLLGINYLRRLAFTKDKGSRFLSGSLVFCGYVALALAFYSDISLGVVLICLGPVCVTTHLFFLCHRQLTRP